VRTRNVRSLDRRKRRRSIVSAVLALVVLLLAGLGAYLLMTRTLVVREVAFIGNRHLKDEDLSALIGIRPKERMFTVSAREIHRRVMTSAWIKAAVVSKDLSGRIEVRVVEAVPAAVLRLSEKAYLVDSGGVVLDELRDVTAFFLPVLRDIDPSENRETYAEALRLVKVLHERKLVSYGGSLQITGRRPEDITLTVDQVPIRVGVGDVDMKLERLKFVKDEIERRKLEVEYVDLRFLDRIVIKPVSHEPPKTARPSDGKKKRTPSHDRRP
jgi:cell division protein FtsQ